MGAGRSSLVRRVVRGPFGRSRAAPEVVGSVLTVVAATRLALTLGAPLAGVLDRCAAGLEADDETASELDAALAGPQQTANLLTWLPVLGLGLGAVLGADPVAVLTDGRWGTATGAVGLGLTLAGRLWVRRMVARARAAGGLG
ncbi:MAG TPA: type II secretion protein F [Cellulomonas sp.]